MEKEIKRAPGFNDIVFELRNKEYGAYILRKNYNRNVIISVLIGIIVVGTLVITPYLSAKAAENRTLRAERQVEIKLENLDQPADIVTPPPAPPPPPVEAVQQQKYIPPEVVDTIKPDEMVQLMTMDEAQMEVKDEEVIEIVNEVKEEIQEVEAEPEPFLFVEEMPEPQGGQAGLMKYIYENTVYPEIAKENNVYGTVIVRFCVTADGSIDKVSIYKSVDPELDAEAIRVVKSLPPFKPGRQGGVAVPVWFIVPINYQIRNA